jgi:hypothetical protein
VVLSDGQENTAPMLSSVSGSITSNTFAVGLGLPSNISVGALTELCQGNDGYLLITGELDTEQSRLLSKYFLQILAGVSNAQVAVDPAGELRVGVEHRVPFEVTEADVGMDVLLLTPLPPFVEFHLETPTGDRITPADAAAVASIDFIERRHVAYYRAGLPVDLRRPDRTHAGTWHAVLTTKFTPDDIKEHFHGDVPDRLRRLLERLLLPYDLIVHTYSNLVFDASLTQSGFEPGATVSLSATLKEYDVPVDGRAQVFAEVTRPDGTDTVIVLPETGPGRFSGSFVTDVAGTYPVRVRATGETFHGRRFTRERTLTAAVSPGGGRPPKVPERDAWCELVECLAEAGLFRSELADRWRKVGIDVDQLVKCLRTGCRPAGRRIG